ncbi:hypothetical protein HHX47_DHR5000469 [Lentinula edodes]|nr:hypothetical protein HHX47_DHR5000469 [Lentinula edodes]
MLNLENRVYVLIGRSTFNVQGLFMIESGKSRLS